MVMHAPLIDNEKVCMRDKKVTKIKKNICIQAFEWVNAMLFTSFFFSSSINESKQAETKIKLLSTVDIWRYD